MTIYLVRHGQTVWNFEKRMQGQCDSPLTPSGIEQAVRIGRDLRAQLGRDGKPEVTSSPLGRAMQTAELVCRELGIEASHILQDDRLMEANHGDWSGLVKADVKQQYPRELAERRENRWNFRFPGGESYVDLARRAALWYASVRDHEGSLVVVTHEMLSRCIRGHYLGLDSAQTLQLSHPHEAVYVLANGQIELLPHG